jgi:hypothetical protein
MKRLGEPIVECAWCDATRLLRGAYRVMRYKHGEQRQAMAESFAWLCSLSCAHEYACAHAGATAERWFSCSMRNAVGSWSEIGTYNLAVFDGWRWNDTGEAKWIEENAERLREAGEIS